MIKLIALDLDRTTLCSDNSLSERNRNALETAISNGVNVVIATGRPLTALPENVTEINGIQFALTSNGAQIIDLRSKRSIYDNFIDPASVQQIKDTLGKYDYMVEVITGGEAYMEKRKWEAVRDGAKIMRKRDYVVNTRRPVDNVLEFMMEHKDALENVNIFFNDIQQKNDMHDELAALKNVTLTTSFPNNWEIGGASTSKATALKELGKLLGVKKEEMMACGDSPNDIPMLKTAGTAVAMGNAEEPVKKAADYVTASNDEDGVAKAVEKFVLQ